MNNKQNYMLVGSYLGTYGNRDLTHVISRVVEGVGFLGPVDSN